ncbi:hypothetical protein CDD83_9102 [Cordyceps sp. RAO-2017]|nr:hypothetical protein CDD83_9102 [Cordyceps sp. RAO-2017]
MVSLSLVVSAILLALPATLATVPEGQPDGNGTIVPRSPQKGAFIPQGHVAEKVNRLYRRGYDKEVKIDLYITVVAASEAEKSQPGYAEAVDKQVEVLQDGFRTAGFTFDLKQISWEVNKKLAYENKRDPTLRRKLRKGGNDYRVLNLYIAPSKTAISSGSGDQSRGWAQIPYSNPNQGQITADGCIILTKTLPGYNADGRQFEGKIAIHEVGHWLGLNHTFGDSCDVDDGVSDTPRSVEVENILKYDCHTKPPFSSIKDCTGQCAEIQGCPNQPAPLGNNYMTAAPEYVSL